MKDVIIYDNNIMGKLMDRLQLQLKTEYKQDAEDCLEIYNHLKNTTGHVWESQWNQLVETIFEGWNKRRSKPTAMGYVFIKGLNNKEVMEEQTKCYCGHTTYCDCGPKELELTQLEPLEVPMPIQNKSISSWNKSNTSPKFDGEYLCYISCREECGNVHRYYKVVSNSFNTWLINENERVALWKELPKNPFKS